MGLGVVGVVLLGLLLMWMYRKGKKAAAGQANKGLKQDEGLQVVDNSSWAGGADTSISTPISTPGFAPSHGLEVAGNGSRDDYSELHNKPVYYSELGGAQRSELHAEHVTTAELPSDGEVTRAGGRRW